MIHGTIKRQCDICQKKTECWNGITNQKVFNICKTCAKTDPNAQKTLKQQTDGFLNNKRKSHKK